jgi:polyisoprenoid-binding protein YceI
MATTTWALEPSHSELQFKIRHLMISNVTGHFQKFEGSVETEGDELANAKINFTIDVDSISTNNEQRDGHLKSPDFFDVASHPQIKFESTSFTKVDEENYKLEGHLTMHGVTHPASLDVEYGGTIKDPWGNTRAGFTVEGKINRKDWNLSWNGATEAGGLVLGEDVKVHANVEFVKA